MRFRNHVTPPTVVLCTGEAMAAEDENTKYVWTDEETKTILD